MGITPGGGQEREEQVQGAKGVQRVPGFLHLFLSYRVAEGVLKALERMKVILTSLDLTFQEARDELEVVVDGTGVSTDRGGQYVVATWGKGRDSKLLKVKVVMERGSSRF